MILGAVVLAAGQGTRMKSALPKVLHPLAGRPMIGWVLGALDGVSVAHTVVVVGHGADAVAASLPDGVTTRVQEEQNGTGHATQIGVAGLTDDHEVVHGINTRVDLAACEAILQGRLREALMLEGVTLADPAAVYVDADVRVGRDTVILPGVQLRGTTDIGSGCTIGPNCLIEDSIVEDGAQIINAVVRESRIGPSTSVGPFAYVRPATVLSAAAKIGTFVETKNATIGSGAKVPHLSYIGDAEIGEGTNIGAGNITANYDGFRKHRTTVGARVKTGSDCVLVAPVSIGDDAMTGAGSIITDDVPAGALGIARARQSNVDDFTRRAAAKARAASDQSGGHQG